MKKVFQVRRRDWSDISNSACRSRLGLNVDIEFSNMKVSEDLLIYCFGRVVRRDLVD